MGKIQYTSGTDITSCYKIINYEETVIKHIPFIVIIPNYSTLALDMVKTFNYESENSNYNKQHFVFGISDSENVS